MRRSKTQDSLVVLKGLAGAGDQVDNMKQENHGSGRKLRSGRGEKWWVAKKKVSMIRGEEEGGFTDIQIKQIDSEVGDAERESWLEIHDKIISMEGHLSFSVCVSKGHHRDKTRVSHTC